MSALPKNHIRGICITCGKPTNRHWRAVYCWPCQSVANDNNEKRAIKKRKLKVEKEKMK